MTNQKNSAKTSILPMVLGLTLSFGVAIGYIIGDKSFSNNEVRKSTQKYGEILNHINKSYVDSVDVISLSEDNYNVLLDQLDPHTRYIPLKNQKEEQSVLEKDFAGIGIEFNLLNDTIFVLKVLENGPAYKSGMLSGDRIIDVDGEKIAGVGITHGLIFEKLKGKVNQGLSVSVKRRNLNGLLELEITRKKIKQRSLNIYYMINKTTGYIKLNKFSRDASVSFSDAIIKLKKQGMKSLVFDLRENTGGYLIEATDIVDQFLEIGDTIVYTLGRSEVDKQFYQAEVDGVFQKGALIILIDENSASASEIVSGAIQDNDRGLLVGRRTYGKGLVQTPITLSDGSGLTLTTSRYYTPSGRCIQRSYENEKEYHLEQLRRYENGEMFVQDSMKNIDSLKFKTKKGRTVYGGGGVSPDVFVPDDTTNRTAYFNKLISTYLLIEFSVYYAQDHKEELEGLGLDKFVSSFKVSNRLITDLASFAQMHGLETNTKELWRSAPVIASYVKTYIAKELWDNLGYYRVKHIDDLFINKSMSSIDAALKLAN